MIRIIIPISLIVAAVGLFVIYINPTYQTIKGLSAQAASYDDALNKSQELKGLRDTLLDKFNNFSADDKQRIARSLPDNVDNIRLIIDINNVAARHELTLKGVSLGSLSDGRSNRSAGAVGSSGDPVGSVEVSFSVTSTYEEFLSFLADLEHSLRIIDVTKISFVASDAGRNDYSMTIRTYWLH
jgi:Tfp pilus assembly protein PilO